MMKGSIRAHRFSVMCVITVVSLGWSPLLALADGGTEAVGAAVATVAGTTDPVVEAV